LFLDALAQMRVCGWAEATRLFEASIDALDSTGRRGTFEQMYALSQLATIGYILHDLPLLTRTLSRYRALVGDHQSAILSHEHLFRVIEASFAGRPADAAAGVAHLERALPASVPTIQRALAIFVERVPHLSGREGRVPPRPFDANERALIDRFRLLHISVGSIYASTGAMIEAQALRAGHPAASARRARQRARLALRLPPLFGGTAERAIAYVEDACGRPTRAIEALRASEASAEASGRVVEAAIARFQRGLRAGGDRGRELCARAVDVLAERGLSEDLLYEDPLRTTSVRASL
jgi:hypothetical protein